jgi:hypothetical protein
VNKETMVSVFSVLFTIAFIIYVVCTALSAQAVEFPPLKSVQAHGGLNVRESPSAEAKAIYLLEDTETVFVLEWQNGWALVAKNISPGMVLGWACGDYLR